MKLNKSIPVMVAPLFSLLVTASQASMIEDFKLNSNISDIPKHYVSVDENRKQSDSPIFTKGDMKKYTFVPKDKLESPSTFIDIISLDGKIVLENGIIYSSNPSDFDNAQKDLKSTMGKPIATSSGIKDEVAFKNSPYYCGVTGRQECPSGYFEIYHKNDMDYSIIEVKHNSGEPNSNMFLFSGITSDGTDMVARESKR